MQFLEGKKTIIVAIVLGVATVLKTLNYMDDATYQTIYGLLTSAGLVTMRSAISQETTKVTDKVDEKIPVKLPARPSA